MAHGRDGAFSSDGIVLVALDIGPCRKIVGIVFSKPFSFCITKLRLDAFIQMKKRSNQHNLHEGMQYQKDQVLSNIIVPRKDNELTIF